MRVQALKGVCVGYVFGSGWWGQRVEDRFSFAEPNFVPTPGASGFQVSTPSPLLAACIRASLDVFIEAGGMPKLRPK